MLERINIANQILDISFILQKYGIMYEDFNSGNLTHNDHNVVIIDYEEMNPTNDLTLPISIIYFLYYYIAQNSKIGAVRQITYREYFKKFNKILSIKFPQFAQHMDDKFNTYYYMAVLHSIENKEEFLEYNFAGKAPYYPNLLGTSGILSLLDAKKIEYKICKHYPSKLNPDYTHEDYVQITADGIKYYCYACLCSKFSTNEPQTEFKSNKFYTKFDRHMETFASKSHNLSDSKVKSVAKILIVFLVKHGHEKIYMCPVKLFNTTMPVIFIGNQDNIIEYVRPEIVP